MADDDYFGSGLLSISISDSEGDGADQESTTGTTGTTTTTTTKEEAGRAVRDRTGQSEAEFQAVKHEYRAKVENGEIWRCIKLPLGQREVPKHEAQELLRAVEELYFFRRHHEAVSFIGMVFEGEGGAGGLDGGVQELLKTYESRCLAKLGRASA